MKKIKNNEIWGVILRCSAAGLLVLIILWSLFFVKKYAPFGENTLVWEDGNYQYLDLFAYLKDVLNGENSIAYSFSKGPGGGMIGVFCYYLSSPLNIIIKAFDKSDLVDFFDILVSLKLSLAAVTFSLFLDLRFRDVEKSYRKSLIIILLSVSYALGQYSIAQASNIMWLDGVYMLPLVLAGVYVLVIDCRMVPLSVTIAATILFNWYSGVINCLFACCWLVFETATAAEKHKKKLTFVSGKILCFFFSSLVGILISGFLFLPMIGAITKSAKGVLNLDSLFDPGFIGNFFAPIGNYVPGYKSEIGEVSLYCGSFAISGCICAFFSKDISKAKRIKLFSLLIFTFLFFSWKPFVTIFSIFKKVDSFWYRYSYVGIFLIAFLSACFFIVSERKTISKLSLQCGIGTAFIISYYNLFRYEGSVRRALISSSFILLCSGLVSFICCEKRSRKAEKIGCLLLVALILSETVLGTALQMDNYHLENAFSRRSYSLSAEKRWGKLKEYDKGEYRTAQTCTYGVDNGGKTAFFNEPLAYNYRGITSYTSSPDQATLTFMDNVGYREYAGTLNEILAPILGVYSILGVKYVASDEKLTFLNKTDFGTESSDDILIYENKYAFPLAFKYCPTSTEYRSSGNPFEFQNSVFTELTGIKENLYYPLDYTAQQQSDSIIYTIDLPEDESVIYGNLVRNRNIECKLYINGKFVSNYGGWLSSAVFHIPVEDGRAEVKVGKTLETLLMSNNDKLFYAIRLDVLRKAADEVKSKQADMINLKNGEAHFSVESNGNEYLFVSIPYDSDWIVERNAEPIETKLVGGYLYSIPLTEGINEISFSYRVRYKTEGIICTLLGMILLFAEVMLEKKNSRSFEGQL